MCEKKQFFGAWKIVCLQSLSFLQVIGENNVSGSQVYLHLDFEWIGSSPSMREKEHFSELDFFLQNPVSTHKTIRGHSSKKMNRNRDLQTSRISSNLRIWQSYSRVPQTLTVLRAWYSWKYVARHGFEPLKFLYNTQVVIGLFFDSKNGDRMGGNGDMSG